VHVSPPHSPPNENTSVANTYTGRPQETKWNNLFFTFLWAIQFIGVSIVGLYALSKDASDFETSDITQTTHSGGTYGTILVNLAVAGLLSIFWLIITRSHPKAMIWLGLLFGIAVSIASLIAAIAVGSVAGIIFGAIFLVINVIFVISVRSRIPFSAAILTVAIESTRVYPSVYVWVVFGIILQIAFSFLFFVTAGPIIYSLNNKMNVSNNVIYFVYFLLALSYYWTAEVIVNLIHVTVAGIAGSWYFLYPQGAPSNVSTSSFRRASTYSFGSICMGSLIVAAIRTIRLVLSYLRGMAARENNLIVVCIVCCIQCIFAMIESIVRYINQYAYVYIAIYGLDYIEAAKRTFSLLQTRGFDAIINDTLIDSALTVISIMTALLTGLISALVAGLIFKLEWPLWAALGFIIGLAISLVVTSAIDSTVVTLFVCLAEDPQILATTKPSEYALINDAFHNRYNLDVTQNYHPPSRD
jgi:hypothetical protein